jgi:hypothetical protein
LEKDELDYYYLESPENYRYYWMRQHISNWIFQINNIQISNVFFLSRRILKSHSSNTVNFGDKLERDHFKIMFRTQKEIMKCVGFLEEVWFLNESDGKTNKNLWILKSDKIEFKHNFLTGARERVVLDWKKINC